MRFSPARCTAVAVTLALLAVAPIASAQSAAPGVAKAKPALQATTATLDSYIGNYQMPDTLVTISAKGGKLIGSAPGKPDVDLDQLEPSLFFIKELDLRVRFDKAVDGVTQMRVEKNGQTFTAKRQ